MRLVDRRRWAGSSVTRDYVPPPSYPEPAPRGMSAAAAKAPRPPAVPTCSYCGTLGGRGRVVVCGAAIECPVCTGLWWPELVRAYGTFSA